MRRRRSGAARAAPTSPACEGAAETKRDESGRASGLHGAKQQEVNRVPPAPLSSTEGRGGYSFGLLGGGFPSVLCSKLRGPVSL